VQDSVVTHRETAKEIDAQAALWAVRLENGPLPQQQQAELDAWLSGDARRLGALTRLRAFAAYSERLKALGVDGAPVTRGLSRRQWLIGGGLAAGFGAAALSVGALSSRGQLYRTQKGQMRVIALQDGSLLNLNTQSRARVHYTASHRHVRLEDGEAFFEVAKSPERPFVVQAGGAEITATGTSFSVRRLTGEPLRIAVREGVVRLGGSAPDTRLAADVEASVLPGHPAQVRVAALAPAQIEAALAWREGKIAFHGETLASAAAQFLRYSDIAIVIDDDAIAADTVTGLYQANDPVGFAKAVALSYGLRASVSDGQVRLSL
jgi:transmembrane sensor